MAIHAYYHVTPAGADTKDGTTWAKAMGEAEFETFIEGTMVAGDVFFVKEGTYTLDSAYDWHAIAGTATAPIAFIGVKSATTNEGSSVVYSDWASGSARPFFDGVTYGIITSDYNIFRNISFQSSAVYPIYTGSYAIFENCRIEQDTGTSGGGKYAVRLSSYCKIINCEIYSAHNGLVDMSSSMCTFLFNYFHSDSKEYYGFYYGGGPSASLNICFNIFSKLYIALPRSYSQNQLIMNNVFYDCDTAITGSTGYNDTILNNIFEGCVTDGIKWTTQTDHNFFWKNHGDDTRDNDMWDGVDVTTIFQDYGVTVGDPKFHTAGSDFALDTGSPCLDTGFSMGLGV